MTFGSGLLIKVITVVAVIGAIFGSGYYIGSTKEKVKCEKGWQEYRAKQENLKNEIEEVQIQIVERLVPVHVEKIKKVIEKEVIYVNEAEQNVPDRNELSNGWVHVHNSSAQGILPEPTRSADETSSGVAANQALSRVVKNYSVCEQNRQQLIDLQQWIRDTQKSIEQANAKVAEGK